MVKNTKRDKVWSLALILALQGNPFKLKHIQNWLGDDAPSDRTTRDVLNTMKQHGWLEKEKLQSEEWSPGIELETILELKREYSKQFPENREAAGPGPDY